MVYWSFLRNEQRLWDPVAVYHSVGIMASRIPGSAMNAVVGMDDHSRSQRLFFSLQRLQDEGLIPSLDEGSASMNHHMGGGGNHRALKCALGRPVISMFPSGTAFDLSSYLDELTKKCNLALVYDFLQLVLLTKQNRERGGQGDTVASSGRNVSCKSGDGSVYKSEIVKLIGDDLKAMLTPRGHHGRVDRVTSEQRVLLEFAAQALTAEVAILTTQQHASRVEVVWRENRCPTWDDEAKKGLPMEAKEEEDIMKWSPWTPLIHQKVPAVCPLWERFPAVFGGAMNHDAHHAAVVAAMEKKWENIEETKTMSRLQGMRAPQQPKDDTPPDSTKYVPKAKPIRNGRRCT